MSNDENGKIDFDATVNLSIPTKELKELVKQIVFEVMKENGFLPATLEEIEEHDKELQHGIERSREELKGYIPNVE